MGRCVQPFLTVGPDRGDNAALAAASILAAGDDSIGQSLTDYRSKLKDKVLSDAEMVEVKTSI